jgi:antibiotic biosynthesis monooxygenase (ABM) superfamily enzyme
VENSNIAIGSLPTLQTSHGLSALFEQIYYGEPIFTDFDFSIALLRNNYSLQIIETGFAEQFSAFQRMGPAPICLTISARIAERVTYRMIPLKTRLFSHWSIPLNLCVLYYRSLISLSRVKRRVKGAVSIYKNRSVSVYKNRSVSVYKK